MVRTIHLRMTKTSYDSRQSIPRDSGRILVIPQAKITTPKSDCNRHPNQVNFANTPAIAIVPILLIHPNLLVHLDRHRRRFHRGDLELRPVEVRALHHEHRLAVEQAVQRAQKGVVPREELVPVVGRRVAREYYRVTPIITDNVSGFQLQCYALSGVSCASSGSP